MNTAIATMNNAAMILDFFEVCYRFKEDPEYHYKCGQVSDCE